MEVYDSRDCHMDLLLAQMYARIVESGEIHMMFATPHTLGSFIAMFVLPNNLIFDVDDDGITMAMWFEPMFSGAFVSVWIRPDRRQSPSAFKALIRGYDAGFQLYPILLGITKQKELLATHRKLGYILKCEIPGFFGGKTAYVVQLDRKRFYKRFKKVKEWADKAEAKKAGSGSLPLA